MKIAIIGYGKMGKTIEQTALEKGHSISHRVAESKELDQLSLENTDVAVEFTQPDSATNNISHCINHDIPVVSGTTGWLEDYHRIVDLANSQKSTFLYSSNFSIGANIFFELNKWLAHTISKLGFNPWIEEIHHTEKKDSPSGTAVTLADSMIKNNPGITGWINKESTDPTKLGIVSKRIANVPGTHTVSYDSELESIVVQHTTKGRSVFAIGVVLVAEWIQNKKGVFTMSDFLNQQ